MGRGKGTTKAKPTKRIGRQTRLDELFTPPRRSTRLRSGTLEKPEILKPALKKQITTTDTTILEVERSPNQVVTLLKTKSSKKHVLSQAVKPREKEAVVPKSEDEQRELLKYFDLNAVYGPCRGISRHERYLRAIKYDLMPAPDGILKILDEHRDDFTFQVCVWDQNELLKLHLK